MSRRTRIVLGLVLLGGLMSRPLTAAEALPPLAEAKLKGARAAYEAALKAFHAGKCDPEKVYLWSRRWMEAQCHIAEAGLWLAQVRAKGE